MNRFTAQPWETATQWFTGSPRHLYNKALHAHRGGDAAWGVMSTGEKVAVAVVLNRFDWLQEMDYTIADAIERMEDEWVLATPRIAHLIASGAEIG